MATTRFVVDAMLGSLARWLRILGFDARYADNAARDDEIAALAAAEGRIVVTRDRQLAQATKSVLVSMEDDLDEQLAKVLAAVGERPTEETLFTRCSLCNEPLATATAEEARGRVPEGVLALKEARPPRRLEEPAGPSAAEGRSFKKCTACGQVYWKGSHWERIVERFERLKRRLA